MNSTPARLSLGVVTFLPLAYLIWHVSWSPSPAELDSYVTLDTMLGGVALAISGGFSIYAFRTDRVPQPQKALWAVLLLMGGMIMLPVFWFVYVRPATWPAPRPDL